MPADVPQDSKPLREIKQMFESEKNSTSKKETIEQLECENTTVRNGFRRKKGDSPLVHNLNLKVKKEKKQSNFTNPNPWTRIVGIRNTAAIYIYCWYSYHCSL